jgi:HAD superfamily hydrolase (TIGR01509 family)
MGNNHACIFDMDGLLIDSEPVNKKSWQASAANLGYALDEEKYTQLLGMRMRECELMLLRWFGNEFPLEKFRKHMYILRESIFNSEGIRFKQGARELLLYLKDTHVRCALATSSTTSEVNRYFNGSGLLSCFKTIVTAEHITNSKPDPEIYLLTCEKLAVPPAEAYVFEDSLAGMQAAFAAGCRAIMVPDLILPTVEIRQKAFKIYPSLLDAFELFPNH